MVLLGKIFITSDLHFSHQNILLYEKESREQFSSIEEMNAALIANWNSVVSPSDRVYVCGDFFMGKNDTIHTILPQLNGQITLIRGNHDTPARMDIMRQHGVEVKDIDYISYKGKFFILCHFPVISEEMMQMLTQDNSEVCVLYGHVHHNAPKGYQNNTYHIGVDTNNLTPVTLENIWAEICNS